ncbi:MAG: Do family serine endopeptidase [Pseudomonadota bacterium]
MKILGKLLVYIIVLARVSSVSAATPTQITSFADIIEPLMPSVVNIYTVKYSRQPNPKTASLPEILPFDKFNSFLEQFNMPFSFDDISTNPSTLSLGSGFIVDPDGYIITNDHVVSGSDEIYIKLLDNTEVPARIIGTDPKTDLALLKINVEKKLPAAEFADSSKVRVGDIVIAIGNPLGFGGTVTTGIISSKGRDLGLNQDELVDDFLQTDAAINTGNSGGPLYDIQGKVVGINTSVPDINGGTNIGIGFAIPANTVTDIMKQLKEKGKISRGRLDIGIQEVTQELADAMSLKEASGVLVVNVKPDGTGDKAGLKQGDLITKYNGNPVLNSRKLQLFVADSHIGDKVKLTVIRNSKTVILTAKITEPTEPQKAPQVIEKEDTTQKAGITFSNISPNLLGKLDLDENATGIVVVGVNEQGIVLDLRIGDLILAIDQKNIENIQEFNEIYKEQQSNSERNNVVLLVKRGDYTMFVAIPLK